MKIPFLASLFVFILLIAYENRKHRKIVEKSQKGFWERERLANNTRRKPLDNLTYIVIPYDTLPVHLLTDDPQVQECMQVLEDLRDLKIVNLTGISNTDLKLTYGTANITCLTAYDQSYTLLVRTLQRWAELLLAGGYRKDAQKLLEFAISTRTDVSRTYYLLADMYREDGEHYKVERLIETAGMLNSALRNSIVRTLQESDPYNDLLHFS